MQARALIFDVDGTLADTEDLHRRAFNEAFARHGLGWTWNRPQYAELLRITGGKERIAAHLAILGLPSEDRRAIERRIAEIHRTKTQVYARMMTEAELPLREGVERICEEAMTAGVPLAIASTTTLDNVRALLERHWGAGALGRFVAVAAGDDVERKKPWPDAYLLALSRLGAPATACVAFEDSANGLAAAKGAGLCAVVTPSRWTMDEDFSAADLVLPSLGSPGRPLTGRAAERVGAPMLGLEQIEELLATTRRCA